MPERTPLDRGQLEDAQDGRRGGRVLRRAAAADRRDPARRRHLPAVHGADRRGRARATARAVQVAAQNMYFEESGAFTGEVSAPMLLEPTSRRSSSATPSAASTSARPTRRWRARCRRRWRPGWSRSSASARARRRATPARPRGCWSASSRPTWPRSRPAGLAEVVIAYEPIWAIGTGRTATPEQAQEACAFIRDVLRERGAAGRRGADPLRRLGQARQRRRAAGQPDIDGALVGGAEPRPGRIRRDRRGCRVSRPDRFPRWRWSSSTAGAWPSPGPATRSRWPRRRSSIGSGSSYPHTELSAQGRDVGLPEGQMGNSEVGHLNLGAGAIVKQDLARIDDAIADGSFFDNEALLAACDRARRSPRGRLHLLGLVSDGGVHSGWEHIEATIELASQEGVPDVVFHAFTDGRDTLPHGGRELPRRARALAAPGRPDRHGRRPLLRDGSRHRWERTKLAYDAIVHARGLQAASAAEAIADSYEREETDEFIKPTVIGDYDGAAAGDVVIFFNFRPDRMRQMTRALADPGFDEFARGGGPVLDLTTMTAVPQGLALPGRLPRGAPEHDAGRGDHRGRRPPAARRRDREVRPRHLLLQRRPRGGVGGGGAAPGRLAPRRPDLRPQARDERPRRRRRLRLALVGGRLPLRDHQLRQPRHGRPHRGRSRPRSRAVEAVDGCLGDVVAAVEASGGACIITADHGNCEHMLEPDGSPNTAHTTNPVPLITTARGSSCATAASSPTSPRRPSTCSASRSPRR